MAKYLEMPAVDLNRKCHESCTKIHFLDDLYSMKRVLSHALFIPVDIYSKAQEKQNNELSNLSKYKMLASEQGRSMYGM